MKRGEILIENIIFIILNLSFLLILAAFLLRQGSGAVLLEDAYSKQIALLIDASPPGTILKVNMQNCLDVAKEEGMDFDDVVSFDKNYVHVNLTSRGGKAYHYFNDVDVSAYADKNKEGEYTGLYIITVSDVKEKK